MRMRMKQKTAASMMGMMMFGGSAAWAQDSTGIVGCVTTTDVPGDAVSPWDDATAANGSEQVNDFVVDLSPFSTSCGTVFGLAPLVKTSKTSTPFSGSLISAQGMSRRQRFGVPYTTTAYMEWLMPGFGVNNDSAKNMPGTPVFPTGPSSQFAVMFSEFATTDSAVDYNGIIGAVVNYDPADPTRLYVRRVMGAVSGCDDATEFSTFGAGSIEEDGNLVFRADDFGLTGGVCAGGPASLVDDNVFKVSLAMRDAGVLNVVSNSHPGGGFDAAATDWLARNETLAHNAPGILPGCAASDADLYIGSEFGTTAPFAAGKYKRGATFPTIVEDTTHLAPGVVDHRGNISYTSKNCPVLGSTRGVAALYGKATSPNGDPAQILNVWGVNASGNVTGKLALTLPATLADNCDPPPGGPIPAGGMATAFEHYRSQTAFRGGNGPIALGVDQDGNLLVAAVGFNDAGAIPPLPAANWPLNHIAVAKVNCASGAVSWKLAAWIDISATGKEIFDCGGAPVARLVAYDVLPFAPEFGPSISAPMFDSVGNLWFLASIELYDMGMPAAIYTTGLIRGIYDKSAFCWDLELVLTEEQEFLSMNTGLMYKIDSLRLVDDNSIDSGSVWSQNISELAHTGRTTAGLATDDAETLGGLVFQAEVVYDVDLDGDYDQCNVFMDSMDQSYQVLMYLGATTAGQPYLAAATDADCELDPADVAAGGACACGKSVGGFCQYTCISYGDANCSGGDPDLDDILCVLDGFANFSACPSGDIHPPCAGNNGIGLDDILFTIDAFAGIDPCECDPCGPVCNPIAP